MKSSTLLFGLFVLMLICAFVESDSDPRQCERLCSLTQCEADDCECGTHKDGCSCCDICSLCAGATCNPDGVGRCEEGYWCGRPFETIGTSQMHDDGTCVSEHYENNNGRYSS